MSLKAREFVTAAEAMEQKIVTEIQFRVEKPEKGRRLAQAYLLTAVGMPSEV